MYWHSGALKLRCFFLKGSTWLREGPCMTKGAGFAWQMQGCDPVSSQLWVHGFRSRRALPPAHTSPTAGQEHHPQLQLFLCWQTWSCPLGGCMSTCEGFKNCPGSSFLSWIWCALEVIWFLDDTNFNFSSVLHLLWHKKSGCWYFQDKKHLCKQLLKDPNDSGSQSEKRQDDQRLKFSRTEEDNAVLNKRGHSSSCKCDPSTLPQSTQLLKTTGT